MSTYNMCCGTGASHADRVVVADTTSWWLICLVTGIQEKLSYPNCGAILMMYYDPIFDLKGEDD